VLIWMALLIGSGCVRRSQRSNVGAERDQAVAMKVLRHDNGLILHVPDGAYDVVQTPAGYRLSLVGSAQRRTPVEVSVELRTGGSAQGRFPESRAVHGRMFRYRVDTEEGGSAGDEHVLRAWAEAGAQHVWIEQGQAVESPATADFSIAWRIAEGIETPQR
jgi:hypothetical protein